MTATRHLISLGHRQIAMINASLETLPAQERLEGYREALLEAGLPYAGQSASRPARCGSDGFNRDAGCAWP